ncbi:hypothetical protein C7U65_06695 [Bradyrhizobium sp. WBAH23]|nr:hypothetical protein [Bradyrhizobium sp. WBAH30]MDD1541828.1 hypothetical protein [Bradyrhizobium sp. WBAH41]MDD1555306.1 hypothetical protein [Bradyrhizobium sp. WBAH23]MDD1587731.1 hypothetical protein [Bradyrhizobium sp. WBAH42]NRB87297.1 hypothetical protein [Bradyrhizobium sp. WBAH10]
MLVLMGPVIASAAKQSRVFPQAAVWIASLRSQLTMLMQPADTCGPSPPRNGEAVVAGRGRFFSGPRMATASPDPGRSSFEDLGGMHLHRATRASG